MSDKGTWEPATLAPFVTDDEARAYCRQVAECCFPEATAEARERMAEEMFRGMREATN